ncbi:MAG: hypothetical protein FJY92_08405 [Candidatus Hydrogenedentes bacterium]|nr:hypothetical protein [Candidatus Hydrogenedentota bacterium]
MRNSKGVVRLRVAGAVLVVAMSVALSACTSMQNPFQRSSTPPPAEMPPPAAPAPSAEPGPPPPEAGLAISPSQRFADVPLPVGAKEDVDKTFVYEDKNLQIGRMVYTTRSTTNELAQFYINESPAGGWKLVNNIQAAGQELQFVKASKRLTVVVRDLGPAKGRQLWLTVTPDGGQ